MFRYIAQLPCYIEKLFQRYIAQLLQRYIAQVFQCYIAQLFQRYTAQSPKNPKFRLTFLSPNTFINNLKKITC